MKISSRIAAAAVALGVTLAMAGCGSGGGSQASASRALDPNGTLKVAYHLAPGNLDPIAVPIWQLMTYTQPMYDTVTYIDVDGQVQPMLATSWKFTDHSLELNFRDDVTFHDGTKFDAQAFKVNIDRLLAAGTSPVRSMFSAVQSVTVTGAYAASLELSEINSSLPAALGDRGGAMVSPKALADGADLSKTDSGSGPYKLVDYKTGDHAYYERYDGYWDPKAAGTKRLEITAVSDGQARLNGATSKTYDISYLTPSQFEAAKGARLGTSAREGLWFINIFTNRTRSSLGNVKARQALAHAIDRDAICKAVYFDLCKVTSSIFPSDFWGGSPDVGPDYYKYDLEAAKRLLNEAGLPNGFEFTMLYAAGADPYPQLAELMQSQLKKAGITMNLKPVDINQLSPIYFVEKNADAMLGGGGQVADPGQSLQKEFKSGSFLNPSGDAPGGLDEVIAKLTHATSVADRTTYAQEATKTAAQQVLNVPLLQPKVLFAYNPSRVLEYKASYVGAYVPLRGVGVLSGQ